MSKYYNKKIIIKSDLNFIYRIIMANSYLLFLFVITFLSGLYKLKLHLILIIILPIIIKGLFNILTVSKYYIEEISINEEMFQIRYKCFFRTIVINGRKSELIIEKKRRNTLNERYFLLFKLSNKEIIKQYDNVNWTESDFDEVKYSLGANT